MPDEDIEIDEEIEELLEMGLAYVLESAGETFFQITEEGIQYLKDIGYTLDSDKRTLN